MAEDLDLHIAELFRMNAAAMPVIHPLLKEYGRLWIPFDKLENTKALRRWTSGIQMQPSLCMLHQKGQCHGGPKCNQAHVQPKWMARVQQTLQAQPFTNCCLGHGDLASRRTDFQTLMAKRGTQLKSFGTLIPLQPSWLAMTSFFDCYLMEMARVPTTGRPITIDRSRICNLHQRRECKYGPDCRNVHLCRDVFALLPTPGVNNNNATQATVQQQQQQQQQPVKQTPGVPTASVAQPIPFCLTTTDAGPDGAVHVTHWIVPMMAVNLPGSGVAAFVPQYAMPPPQPTTPSSNNNCNAATMPAQQGSPLLLQPPPPHYQPPSPAKLNRYARRSSAPDAYQGLGNFNQPRPEPPKEMAPPPPPPPPQPATVPPREVSQPPPPPPPLSPPPTQPATVRFESDDSHDANSIHIHCWRRRSSAPEQRDVQLALLAHEQANGSVETVRRTPSNQRRRKSKDASPPLNMNHFWENSCHPGEGMGMENNPYMAGTEPATPNTITSETMSAVGMFDNVSEDGDEEQLTPQHPKSNNAGMSFIKDVLEQQTLFQSLTFDLLDAATVSLQLPDNVMDELTQAVE